MRYFLILFISHKTNAIIKTTTITPAHIPTLKTPPIAAQLVSNEQINKKNAAYIVLLFIVFCLIILKNYFTLERSNVSVSLRLIFLASSTE